MSSSKFRLLSLRAEGFRGICEPIEIDFHEKTTLLSAPNGSGKTSILGAIEWALFGELKYQPKENGTNDELVNMRQRNQSAVVTVDLENSDGVLSITRSKRAGKRVVETLVTLPNGDDFEGDEAESAIFRILGLTFEDFYRAVYLHQESIRGLLIDDPRVRNEALDRLFGVEKLRDMLKALSGSTKPVKDALDKLERSQATAVAKLTGAVIQVEEQRAHALEDAKKRGLKESELTVETLTEIGKQVLSQLEGMAKATRAPFKEQSVPGESSEVDSFGRKVTEAIKLIRLSATDASNANSITAAMASADNVLTSMNRISDLAAGIESEWSDMQADFGDLDFMESQLDTAKGEVKKLQDKQDKLGVSERIVQDTLAFLKSGINQSSCPACGQHIEREALIARLENQLSDEIRNEIQATKKSESEQKQKVREFESAIIRRDGFRSEKIKLADQVAGARSSAFELLEKEVSEDQLVSALGSYKDELARQVSNIDAERSKRDGEIDVILDLVARMKDIGRYLQLDQSYRDASSRLGTDDEDSSITDEQIKSLSRLEGGIRTIAQVVTAEASMRAREAVTGAQEGISELYQELCNHPYFDKLSISVESQVLSGVERNSYLIRASSSSENRETLASSRLSTAQMNCVALSVYLALASQLQHNLGFFILDDPSQNLDTEHKRALVRILSRIAPDVQVLLGTQDSELDQLIIGSAKEGSFERFRLEWSALAGSSIVPEDV
jgi:DNA repair exonuclease SbcCD ATPase subunit